MPTSRPPVRDRPAAPHSSRCGGGGLTRGSYSRFRRFESGPRYHVCPIAQMAERRSYKADVGGSKPPRATNFTAVAQRNRARPCEGRGRAFESPQPCHPFGVRLTGRTQDFESWGPGSNPGRRATPGRSSNGKTADSRPANRRSNRRRPANTHAVSEMARCEVATLVMRVRVPPACPFGSLRRRKSR